MSARTPGGTTGCAPDQALVGETPVSQRLYRVSRRDLPLHCPLDGQSLWNAHPRVFLPIEETGRVRCPYCSAEYILVD